MEKKVIKEENNNGLHKKIETIEKNFNDGFVHEADFHQINTENYGKYHKGPEKSDVISTNDPRITRPFLKIICGFFFTIGLFLLLIGILSLSFINILSGIFLIIFISIGYNVGKRPIDKIEKELKQNQEYVNTDSKEVQKEFIKSIGEGWNDAKKSTFTKDNFKNFAKRTIPLYCIITVIIFFLISFFINIILGLFILGILILCGFIYYWIVYKICKW